jgi:hypothetical protein
MLKLAFIVNCFENPLELTCCLASLKLQKTNTEFDISIHVADNSSNRCTDIKEVCKLFEGVVYHKTTGVCYTATEQVVKQGLKADYLCFASSDGYYVPGFALTMMEVVHRTHADLVYCNVLYDPRLHGRGIYSVLETFPEMRWIDKTCYIVKARAFKGFPPHKDNWRDGALVESFVKKHLNIQKAKGVLVVHI